MRLLLFLRKYFSLLPLSHYSAGCNLGEAQIEFLFTAVREMIVENGTFPTRFDARRDEIFPGPEMIIAFCASVNDPRHLAGCDTLFSCKIFPPSCRAGVRFSTSQLVMTFRP